MPKRNYGYEKRQKQLAKTRKREEKAQRKADRAAGGQKEGSDDQLAEQSPELLGPEAGSSDP